MLTEADKKKRFGRVTSSVVAEVLGMSPYGDGASAKKKILRQSTFRGSKATERGDMLERVTLEYVTRLFPTLRGHFSPSFVPIELVRKGSQPWAGDSIDALYFEGDEAAAVYGGEAKTVDSMSKGATLWGEPGTSQVPEHVRIQCLWHLLHWPALDRIYVPVLFSAGFRFELYHVDRHQAAIDAIAEQAFEWWRAHIEGDIDPRPITSSPPEEPEADIDFDRAAELIEEIGALKFNERAAKAALKPLEDELKQLLGTTPAHLNTGAYSMTYSQVGDGRRVDWKAIVRDAHTPDEIIQSYTTKKAPSMRLMIKEL